MFGVKKLVRQVLTAALILVPLDAVAGISAKLDAGGILITGIDAAGRQALMQEPGRVRLQRAGSTGANGMLVSLTANPTSVRIKPRFVLRPGREYELNLDLPGHDDFRWSFALKAERPEAPKLTGFAPRTGTIPANTLRFYLSFSRPMARGQVREAIRLVRADGSVVEVTFERIAPGAQ